MQAAARLGPDAQEKSIRAAEPARADAAARGAWHALQPTLNPGRLVFLNKAWTKTNMASPRGRRLRGQRLLVTAPFGRWKTSTVLASLRHRRLVAPLALDSAR